jgi:hypothetical protein
MYTTNYNWKSFDPLTAKLTVEVDVFWDGTFVETRDIRLTLPVDSMGYATTDTGLIDYLVDERILRHIPDVANNTRIPPLGVVNAEEIYNLTVQVEADELAVDQIMVLLTPNPNFTTSNLCTRSIITVISGRNDFSRPFDLDIPLGLDNGNVVSSLGLVRVRSGTLAQQAGVFDIIAANDNSASLAVAAWVYTQYPNFIVNNGPGFDGYQYYIEHDPIEVDPTVGAITTAVFDY